jgi:YidC/Oxa1 family membrane protein insertase
MRKTLRRLAALPLLLLPAGCGISSEPISADTPGLFDHYVIYPFSWTITKLAEMFGGSYGFALIAATLIVRLAIMPLMLNQSKKQAEMQTKMAAMKPELQRLQEKYKDAGPESGQKMQAEMLALYQKHGYNPLAIGCLPMLLQIPIIFGFYHAIRRTPEIARHTFLWFDLGHPDLFLPVLAAAVYFVQFKVSQIGTDPEMAKRIAWMGWISPVAMGLFSFAAPAALPLYWTVGGLFLIVQTLIVKRLYKPKPVEAEA